MIYGLHESSWPSTRPSTLQGHLEHRLASHFGRRVRIVRFEERASPYASSFPVDELDVQLEDGADLPLVVKDLSWAAMSPSARRIRPGFLYEPRREIQVYRWLLPHAPQGTATWYGAVTNASARQYWLFLERVDGLELRHVGDLSIWERAARWIAQFHQAFSPESVAPSVQTSRLLVYDAAFYWMWLSRARRFAQRDSRTRRVVDRIARSYTAVIDRLVRMPQTLIHGEFYPCNIVVQRRGDEVRVCPVDWEMAAVAPGLMDLASLITGWSHRAQRALVQAYRSAFGTGPRPTNESFALDLDCCRLHLAVRMLGWSDRWVPPPQHARDWLAEAERISARVER